MNSEIIKTLAAGAILDFARTHTCECILSIEDGLVVAKVLEPGTRIYDRTLIITIFAQNSGLTSAAWNIVGTELFSLYNKEKACQAHRKP